MANIIKELNFDDPKNYGLEKGMGITFCGTEYVIDEVLDYDSVQVIQGNGISITLWVNRWAGCKVIIYN